MSAMGEDSSDSTIHSSQRIVVVGIHTILGELLIERLEAHEEISEYWAIDLFPPKKYDLKKKLRKLKFIKLDLIQPGADAALAKTLKDIQATTVVHTASKNNPSLNWVYAHELEVIGTIHLLSAVKAAQVKKFIFCSTTAVYGASPKNPNYVSEEHPLDPHPEAHFIRDKVEAEKQVIAFKKECPDIVVTTLRFCLILGHRSENYFTALFRRPFVPTLLGYDPLMQFIHENDAADALEKTTLQDFRGTFNIVSRGVVPLSYALREAGKLSIPVAPFVAYRLVQVLWNLQLMAVPGRLLDYFRFLWVADGVKAKNILGFNPRLSSKEAFLDFAKSHRVDKYKEEHRWVS
jgi:UDP-glucose 4-epimerase